MVAEAVELVAFLDGSSICVGRYGRGSYQLRRVALVGTCRWHWEGHTYTRLHFLGLKLDDCRHALSGADPLGEFADREGPSGMTRSAWHTISGFERMRSPML
jgi:hypothetical protein